MSTVVLAQESGSFHIYFKIFIVVLFFGLLAAIIWTETRKKTPPPVPPTLGTASPVPPTPGTEPSVSTSFPPLENLRAKLQPNTDGKTQTFWVEFGDGEEISIDWGDGSTETASKKAFRDENKIGVYEPKSHTYTLSGTYNLQISGSCNSIVFSPPGLQTGSIDLTEIVQLGNVCVTVENMCLNNTTITKFTAGESSPYTNLNGVCKDCISLTQVDLAGVSSSVLSADSAWEGCIALTTFDTSTLPALTSAKRCWAGCIGLITFSSTGLLDVANLEATWEGCTGLTTFDNTDGFSNLVTFVSPFVGCTNLTTFINVRGFDTFISNGLALLFFLDLKNTVVSFDNTEGFPLLEDCSDLFSTWPVLSTFNNTRGLASGTVFADTWSGSPITTFDNTGCFPLLTDADVAIAVSYLSSLKSTVVNFNNTDGFALLEDCSNLFSNFTVLTTFNNTRGLASGTIFAGTWTGSPITTFDNTGALPQLNDNATAIAYLGDLKHTVVNFDNTDGFASLVDCSNLFNAWAELTVFNNTRGFVSGTVFFRTWLLCPLLLSFDASSMVNATDCSLAWSDCGLTTFSCVGLSAVTILNQAWSGCTELTSFSTEGLFVETGDTYRTLNLTSAWSNCINLTTFDANGLDTAIMHADSAWSFCSNLTTPGFSGYEGNTVVLSQVNTFNGTAFTPGTLPPSAWVIP